MVQMLDEFRELESRNRDHGLRSPKVHDQDRYAVNGSPDYSMVQQAMKYRLQRLEMENGSLEEGESFFVVDLGYVDRQYKLWSAKIPRALPCYGSLIPSSSLWVSDHVEPSRLMFVVSREMQSGPSSNQLPCIFGCRF